MEKLMAFRVCGNKGIACTVAFVYTQALLAPLLLPYYITLKLLQSIFASNKKGTLFSCYVVVPDFIITVQSADFNGNGILLPMITGGGFLV